MTNMTKEQLGQLLGTSLTDHSYSYIMECISYFSGDYGIFQTENDIVKFYNAFGMERMRRLSCWIAGEEKVVDYYRKELDKVNKRYMDLHAEYNRLLSRTGGHDEETHEDESVTFQPAGTEAKAHFESIANCTVTDDEYGRIEKCIASFSSLLSTDNDAVLFYHTFGMDGINRLLYDLAGFRAETDHFIAEASAEYTSYLDLSIKYNQLSSYISAFMQALVKFFNEILNDPLFSFDYSKSVFHALMDYLNKEIIRFESEVA